MFIFTELQQEGAALAARTQQLTAAAIEAKAEAIATVNALSGVLGRISSMVLKLEDLNQAAVALNLRIDGIGAQLAVQPPANGNGKHHQGPPRRSGTITQILNHLVSILERNGRRALSVQMLHHELGKRGVAEYRDIAQLRNVLKQEAQRTDAMIVRCVDEAGEERRGWYRLQKPQRPPMNMTECAGPAASGLRASNIPGPDAREAVL